MPEVPMAPMAPNAALIGPLSVVVMVSGIVIILAVLSPVRRAFARAADDLTYLKPRPRKRPVATTTAVDTSAEDTAAGPAKDATAPTGRREIDQFDLDLFQ